MNRYDLYKASKIKDIDGDNWPDPLTYNYNKFTQSDEVTVKSISENDISRFWKWSGTVSGGDIHIHDIILNLNNIPWRGLLEPSDNIVVPSPKDLYAMIPNSVNGIQTLQ